MKDFETFKYFKNFSIKAHFRTAVFLSFFSSFFFSPGSVMSLFFFKEREYESQNFDN